MSSTPGQRLPTHVPRCARAVACAALVATAAAFAPAAASAAAPQCFVSDGNTFDDLGTPDRFERSTALEAGHTYAADLKCFDTDGQTLSLIFPQAPTHGTTQLTRPEGTPDTAGFNYTPTVNGTETFSVQASDGTQVSDVFSYSAFVDGQVIPPTPQPAPAPAPAPVPKPAATPAVAFSLKGVPSSVATDAKGNVTLPVSGTPGAKGSVSLSARAPKASASALVKKKAKTLSLGRTSFTVPAKGVAKVKVKLSAKGFKALKKAKRLNAKVTVKSGTRTITKGVKLKAPRASRPS